MTNTQAFRNSTSKLLIHPLLWKLTGFGSSIVGFSCYALSPSFKDLFAQWTPLKIMVYSTVGSLVSILMLLVKRCSCRLGRSILLKAHVCFLVLTLTCVWSFLEDRSEEGKVEKGYGKVMNLTSTGAFAIMALSLSRQLQIGFEVGVFNFLVGCFLVTVMKMSLKLAPVAALFCYLLVNIRSVSDFLLEMRGCGVAEDADDKKNDERESVDTDGSGDFDGYFEDYDLPVEDFADIWEDFV
ncbi:hypothetical protein RJT34_06726 [Clitoria ternatea]|uniref:Transmembrane protein n=1 Tax=Clitoria ternatea TaxID=43366 RepID=A0AAN9K4E9_CLITE